MLKFMSKLNYKFCIFSFCILGLNLMNAMALASSEPFLRHNAITQNIGEYYHNDSTYQKSSNLIFGADTALGQVIDAVNAGTVAPQDVMVFFDFDSTILIKKEETPHKAQYDGRPRGEEFQDALPPDFHDIKNMLFALRFLNDKQIPWAVLTARPDNSNKGIAMLKDEFVNSGVGKENLINFLSPAFRLYQLNINHNLLSKFKSYRSGIKTNNWLKSQGEISVFKLKPKSHPAQNGNLILMAHMPKSWGIYYCLKELKEQNKLPKFVIFIDDSKAHIVAMRDSIDKTQDVLRRENLVIDFAPLHEFTGSMQFILVHYARQHDHLLPVEFFTKSDDLFWPLKAGK